MTSSIPASQLVLVTPSVLSAGSEALALNSVFVTGNTAIPIDSVASFATLDSVKAFFGATSDEASMAANYFSGFTGATILPSKLYFTRFNDAAVAAYLRSASLSSMTLAQLQALSGTLIVTIDGEVVTSPSINLSSATSFTNAAALITTGIQTVGGIFTGTGDLATTTLTIDVVTSGAVHVGDSVLVDGATSVTIVSQTSGTPGGAGIYVVTNPAVGSGTNVSLTVTSAAAATYDSQRHAFVITSPTTGVDSTIGYASGTLAAGISLTSATGAVLSQGADTATAIRVMDAVTAVTQNWALFTTVWEPDLAGKIDFADWVNASNQRYGYVAWDTDVTPTLSEDASGSFGRLTENYEGVIPVWGMGDAEGNAPADIAAFICGTAAAINFNEQQGRITFAYKSQSGLAADVTDATVAQNLISNGYNFYGDYATANDQFQFLQTGQMSGTWKWIDSYVNQIKLNSDLQLAFMDLLTSVKSVPYNQRGYNLLRAAAADPINAGLNFGSIQPGVELSASQIAQIDGAAGQSGVGRTVSQIGYYLQVTPAVASIRVDRGSPPMTLWYADGGSIQKVVLASINVQ